MKFKFNSKYNTIAGYIIITFTICLLIIIAIFKISILQVYLNKLLKSARLPASPPARLLAPWLTRSASTLSNRRFQMSMGAPWARLAMYIGGNNKK